MPLIPPFRHKALGTGEIRLLILLPGDIYSPVFCQIKHVRWIRESRDKRVYTEEPDDHVEDALEYEALSYTWDDEVQDILQGIPPPASVTINSCSMPLTWNLGSALQHLRHPHTPRTIWIDALCINQDDDAEKEQQVQKMHQIYSNAKEVILWLGSSSSDSPKAFHFIKEICSCFDGTVIEEWIKDESKQWSEDSALQQQLKQTQHLVTPEYASSWVALHRLLSRRWWERAWVLQELVVARRVIVCCGSSSISWPILALTIFICRLTYSAVLDLDITIETSTGAYAYDWPSEYVERAFDMLARRAMRLQDQSLCNIEPSKELEIRNRTDSLSSWLSASRHRACLMPHDKIFSILGLLNPALQGAIHPNYKQVASTLYQNVVKAYTATTGRLDLICHSQHSKWTPNQPSWMPDWQRPERAAVFSDIPGHHLSPTITPPTTSINFSSEFNTLAVQGLRIGVIKRHHVEFEILSDLRKQSWNSGVCTIETAANYSHGQVHSSSTGSEGSSWWYFDSSLSSLISPALTTLPIDDAQWCDHFGLFFDMVRLKMYPDGSDWHERNKRNRIPEPSSHDSIKCSEVDFNIFYTHLQGLVKSRTIVETAELQIGVVPDFAQENDVLVWLWGCSVPVLLRSIPRSNGGWMFVGDAYVYRLAEDDVFEEGYGKWESFELV